MRIEGYNRFWFWLAKKIGLIIWVFNMDEEYWDAQIEGFEQVFKKPIWRDYLETQRKLLDEVFSLGLDKQSTPSVKPSCVFISS